MAIVGSVPEAAQRDPASALSAHRHERGGRARDRCSRPRPRSTRRRRKPRSRCKPEPRPTRRACRRCEVVEPRVRRDATTCGAGGMGLLGVRRAVRGDPVPRLLLPGHRRPLQAQAREDRRTARCRRRRSRSRSSTRSTRRSRASSASRSLTSARRRGRDRRWRSGGSASQQYIVWGLLAGHLQLDPVPRSGARHRRPRRRRVHAVRRRAEDDLRLRA